MMSGKKAICEMGPIEVDEVYHGTKAIFDNFSDAYLNSVGFHFGDIEQARHFAKRNDTPGRIIKAKLKFENLVDIGEDDWGWIDCKRVALLCYSKFQQSRLPLDEDAFRKILGPKPWNLGKILPTQKMNDAERRAFIDLLRAHDFDGVRYTNKYEPPGQTGGTAYFVFSAAQIEILGSTPA